MNNSPESSGNPEIGMQGNSLEEAEANSKSNQASDNSDFSDSGSADFFNQLDSEVNNAVIDPEVTQSQTSGPEQVTHAEQDSG